MPEALDGAPYEVIAIIFVMLTFLAAGRWLIKGHSIESAKRDERYAEWADQHAKDYREWGNEMKDAAMQLRVAIGELRQGG